MLRLKSVCALFGVLLGLSAAQVMAQDLPAIADADGNGLWSLAELQVTYPSLTEETFGSVDANDDEQIDTAELSAAIADGAMPEPVLN